MGTKLVIKRVTFVLLALVVVCSLLGFGLDRYWRYKSWRELSANHISDASQWYITHRASNVEEVQATCIYALDCTNDRARLAIIRKLDEYDFEALRQLIWARRFSGTCQGKTANLAMHLVRSQKNNKYEHSDQAIWSFYLNRFVPMHGRFSGGAFSEEPWERCSIEGAALLSRNGVAEK